ncbi:hypothetical protein HD806DRAFT_504929 [Xylariaceae sp. AK1471]|nr:hypothetical protein HD806DRAFT_504929 [Xylariaceae sp. AK1471]
MDKIPPEIIYVVCSLLNVDDILRFRLVNKLFADIGAAYMLPEVTFYMHQEELARLKEISLHPTLSKHVHSLTYFAQTFDSPAISWRDFLRDHKRQMTWNSKLKKLNLTSSQLMAEYKKYVDAVAEQDVLIKEKRDVALLNEVLPRFPQLKALTMSAGHVFYEGNYRTRRKNHLDDFALRRSSYLASLHPEGKHPLDALLMANAHAKRDLTSLRAGSLHWRFFKRSERELTRMFKPLNNLTSIELSISVDPADERIREGNSLRKCQSVMARGSIRKILRSMPQLRCLCIDIHSLEFDEQEKGAWLKDIIEPGFHWPNLEKLVLGGIMCNRSELMNYLELHKNTLQKLCLRDVTLASTSWRKLLPDIRKKLCLTEACVCGDIYGKSEDYEDMVETYVWDLPAVSAHWEYWDLSVPEVGSHDMRESINMYCRQGGQKYPDELPLCDVVVEKNYEEYVMPFFEDDSDSDDYDPGDDLDFDMYQLEGEDDENWEDVSDEELSDDISDDTSDASMDSLDREDAALAFHMVMTGAFGPPFGMDEYHDDDDDDDNDDDDMDDDSDFAAEFMEAHPWLINSALSAAGAEQYDINSDDEMPELVPQ